MVLEHQVNLVVVFIIFQVVAEEVVKHLLQSEEVLVDLVAEEMLPIVHYLLEKVEQLTPVVVEEEQELLQRLQVQAVLV